MRETHPDLTVHMRMSIKSYIILSIFHVVFATVRVASLQVIGRLTMNTTNIEITSNDSDDIFHWLTTILDRYRPAEGYAVDNFHTIKADCSASFAVYKSARVIFTIANSSVQSVRVKMDAPAQDSVTLF